MDAKFEGL